MRPTHVEIIHEASGRPSGEARVEFSSRKDYDDALLKDKQYMGMFYCFLGVRMTSVELANGGEGVAVSITVRHGDVCIRLCQATRY